ncbi:hypothetical protein FH581_024490 [Leptospira weilii]|nr:hypothetical protein FH581_024425 [Leptospira weilii]UPY76983.1 hypothetical protein FH581_024430 [Leptospira weilii]UPY80416.1 hypothetical protein FH581_024490 [Leptospira weilii]
MRKIADFFAYFKHTGKSLARNRNRFLQKSKDQGELLIGKSQSSNEELKDNFKSVSRSQTRILPEFNDSYECFAFPQYENVL